MSKQSEKALVPELRFPEFRDADEWKEAKLGDTGISEFVKDRIPLDRLEIESYISTENLLADYAGVKTATKLPPSGSFTQFRKRDILISNIRPYLKKVWQAQMDGSASNDVIVIRARTKIIDNFLIYMLKNDDFINYVMKDAKGVKMPRGDISSIKKYPFCYPSEKEQQKIAECLSSIDDLITAQIQKNDALKAHKKGLMQQLFPAEGETVPKLRFPEFRDAMEWEGKTIGDIGSFYYGKSAPKWSLEKDAPTQCVRYGELYTKYGVIITETYSRTNIDPSKLRFSKGGEILVPRVGEKPEDFGKCCCYLPLANIAIGEMISVFETAENPLFYTYYFRKMYRQFAKVVEGQNVKNLYYVELEPLPIRCPPPQEQKKIADCLSSIDGLITTQAQKIQSLKAHKKGLMQQLFPAAEEMNG